MHKSRPAWFRILHKVHLWIGLILCIPLVLIGLTGSLMVYEHELVDIFSKPPILAQGTSHSGAEIIAAAKEAAPPKLKPTMYRPAQDGEPASVRFSAGKRKPGGGGAQILVDPVSLEIVGKPSNNDFFRTVLQLHSSLLLRELGGRTIVGWLGVCLLTLGISGLVMWWPKKGRLKAAVMVKPGAKGLRLHRDIHGGAGFWAYLIFITTCFTGIYLAFPQTIGGVFTSRDLRAAPEITQSKKSLNIDSIIDIAQNSVPDSKVLAVMFPQKPDQPYRINLALPDYREGTPMITVFVDQYQSKIAETRDPEQYSTGETIVTWAHAVHAGQAFGWVWKLLVFLIGFFPLLFSITGVSMWMIKRRPKRRRKG